MSYSIWADDWQLILDALNRQHDDLRRQAAGRSLAGERYASLRRYHRERADRSAQLATELAHLPYGDYVLMSRRTLADVQADAERDYAAVRPATGQLYEGGPEAGRPPRCRARRKVPESLTCSHN
jgi:hypothetical protein